jgi:hypothetical protein
MRPELPAFDRMVGDFAAEAERAGARARRFWRRGVVLPAAAVALVTAGATLAATGTVRIGSPVKVERPPAGVDLRSPGVVPGSVHLAAARVADPDGGPPWGVRTFRTRDGHLCAQAGRVMAGRLGVIGFDGAFHEVPTNASLVACDYAGLGSTAVRAIAQDSAGRPTGARITADSIVQPASTTRLDVNGMSKRVGCDGAFRRALHGVLSPCDRSRFRYVAWGVLRPGVRELEVVRVPGDGRVTRISPSADRSFVYVLTGGDPQGARMRAVMSDGRVLPVVRAGRQFTLPTGHPDARLERISSARVTPPTGTPKTTFALHWRVPLAARHRGDGWTYRLFGPGGQRCNVRLAATVGEPAGGIVPKRRAREGNEPLPPTRLLPQNGVRLGERVTRRFRPPGPPPRHWCPGSYRGEIRFGDRIVAGRFSFQVR